LQALAGFGPDHPWERAVTMRRLVGESEALDDARQWGRDSVALFRSVGDQVEAANVLCILAQRWLCEGIADDEVLGWLTEAQGLVEAAGSEGDIAHVAVGLADFAWVRADHDRAADIMGNCLPTLRRLGDQRCAGRALLMLGDRARLTGQLAHAEELSRASVESLALAGNSTLLAQALEALAAVFCTQGRARAAAVLLGTAQRAHDNDLRRSLVNVLGAAAFDLAYAEGTQLSATEVPRLAPKGEADD
jgi:hypothetical protein